MRKENIRRISEMIPRRGISRDYQKYILPVVEKYFNGAPVGRLRDYKYGIISGKVYSRIEQIKKDIKNKSLEKIAPVLGLFAGDFREDHLFAEAAIKLFIMNDMIERDFFNTLDIDDEQKAYLRARYKEDRFGNSISSTPDKVVDIHDILEKISQDPGLYMFLKDNIIDKDFP